MEATIHEPNRERLLEMMAANGIKPEDLPALTSYSSSMVKAWLMPDRSSKRARGVPQRAVDLLQLRIEATKKKLSKNA